MRIFDQSRVDRRIFPVIDTSIMAPSTPLILRYQSAVVKIDDCFRATIITNVADDCDVDQSAHRRPLAKAKCATGTGAGHQMTIEGQIRPMPESRLSYLDSPW
jgi:hypothetical protein